MGYSVLDGWLAGSSFHHAQREDWTVLLTPNDMSATCIANFQNIVALAHRDEWNGYRVQHVQRGPGPAGLPFAVRLELIEPVEPA